MICGRGGSELTRAVVPDERHMEALADTRLKTVWRHLAMAHDVGVSRVCMSTAESAYCS